MRMNSNQEQPKITVLNLQQIADMLVLNGTLVNCPGLIHGKTGVAIFFAHYARFTGNKLFDNYTMDLIHEILEQIHVDSPADYEKGIAGIGVGIDYLVRNGFLEADKDIFGDFDQRMVRAVMYDPWQDFSLYDGLTGYGRYWMMRLHQQKPLTQAKECLWYIIKQLKEKLPDITEKEQTDVSRFLKDLQQLSGFGICVEFLRQCSHYLNGHLQNAIDVTLNQVTGKSPAGMGLLNGYAGEGMIRLSALHQVDHSWVQLLL